MGLIDLNKTDDYTLGVWRVEESEEKLKEIVGGTFFPGLSRISHHRRRLEWLAARSLLKEFGYQGLVKYHPSRRPFLANSRSHISISHSFPFVAVILSSDFLVGIDIEYYNRPFMSVTHKYLSEREKKWIDVNDNKMLALVWSAKEAIYKLPGMEGLGGVDMDIKPINTVSDFGNLDAIIRIGGTVQRFNYIRYYYIGSFNVVWVCCNPKTLVW
jgi:hypothetical protein